MSRRLRIIALFCGGLAIIVAAALAMAYRASQEAPEFYRQALQSPPPRAAEASDELLHQATAVASQARRQGRWEAQFTAEQINGWLAVDLEENHAQAIPAGVSDPRVEIRPDGATLACLWRSGRFSTVFSLDGEVYLAEPNVVALRIRDARAGTLPVPLERILDGVTKAVAELDWGLQWRQAEGDPVALITIPPLDGEDDAEIWIDSLELRQDAIYLTGTTLAEGDESSLDEHGAERTAAGPQASDSSNVQR